MKHLAGLLLLACSLWATPIASGDVQTEYQVQAASASVDSAAVGIGEVLPPGVIVQRAIGIDVLMHRLEASANVDRPMISLNGAHHVAYEDAQTAMLNSDLCSRGQHLQLANQATDWREAVRGPLLNYKLSGLLRSQRQWDTRTGVNFSP